MGAPSFGQITATVAIAASSVPVVLTAIQQAALTPPAAIVGFALDSTVAKDSSLTIIDTDLKATQPRSITNFPATQVVSALDLATIVLQNERQYGVSRLQALLLQQQIQVQSNPAGFVPIEIPSFLASL